MKHSLHTRVLALIMAIAIVLSTGVLNSAGWLLASNGKGNGNSKEATSATDPTQASQGGSTTETLTVESTDPTGESTDPTGESTDPTGESTDPTGESTDPTGESTDPTGESTDPTGETTDPTGESTEPQASVKLTVELRAVYADDSRESAVLERAELDFTGDETAKTYAVSIPDLEGYTFAITGAAMELNAETGKYEASLSRPGEDSTLVITVTYTPVPEEPAGEETPDETEVYTVYLTHALYVEGYGWYADQKVPTTVPASAFVDGVLDTSAYAYQRTGVVLTESKTITLEKAAAGQGSAVLSYAVAEGYRAVVNSGASGAATYAIYQGTFDMVTIVPQGQVRVTVKVMKDGVSVQPPIVKIIPLEENGEATFTETIKIDPHNTPTVDNGIGTITAEGVLTVPLTEADTDVTVTVTLTADPVTYTVRHWFQALDGSYVQDLANYPDETKDSFYGEMTAAEAKEVAHFQAQPFEQTPLENEDQVINIYYDRDTYKLTYNTQGGSYVSPVTGMYQQTVNVFADTTSSTLTCTQEVHTHTAQPTESATADNVGTTIGCYTSTKHGSWIFTYYSWDRSCGKTEHIHTDSCYESSGEITPAPTRQGYTFGGWYLDEACTQPASTTMELTGDVTVYAKWIPGTATYTIVAMRQVWDNSTNSAYYAFAGSSTGTGTVGSTVTASSIWSGTTGYGSPTLTSAVVKPDGSTVVYANYPLTVYTFVFNLNRNNAYIQMTEGGTRYTGSQYTISNVVLGKDIADQWPTDSNITATGAYFDLWGASYKTKRFEVTADMLQSNGNNQTVSGTTVTYRASWTSSTTTRYVQYWLESADGSRYEVVQKYSQQVNSSNLSPKAIYGYKAGTTTVPTMRQPDGSAYPSSGSGQSITFGGQTYEKVYVYNFYYDRIQSKIEYFYNATVLETKTDIRFGADINGSSYDFDPTAQVGLSDVYKFKGWYDNAECLGDPYNFTTMPGNDLALYAKFEADPVSLEFVVQYQNPDGSLTTATVPYNGKAEYVTPKLLPGYDFAGWYEDPEFKTPFDFNKPLTQNTIIYAKVDKSQYVDYTVRYLTDKDEEVSAPRTLRGKVDAKVIAKAVVPQGAYAGYIVDAAEQTLVLQRGVENEIIFRYKPVDQLRYTVEFRYGSEVILSRPEAQTDAQGFTVEVAQTEANTLLEKGYVLKNGINSQYVTLSGDNSQNVIVFELELKDFTITYDLNDDDGDTVKAGWPNPGDPNPNPATYTVRSDDITLVNPTRKGYTFLGWTMGEGTTTTGGNGEPDPAVVISNGSAGNLTFVANWQKSDFQVTYFYTGEVPTGASEAPADETHTYGDTVTVAAKPTLDGYTFSGWTTSDAEVTGSSFTMPDKNVAFTGYWTIRDDLSYTVRYMWGDTELDSKTEKNRTFNTKSEVESPKEISGYTPTSTATQQITIDADSSKNVITFYYYKNVVLTAHSDEVTYDGKSHSVSGFDIAAQVEDTNAVTATESSFPTIKVGATGTAASTYPANFPENTEGTVDATDKYIVVKANNGTLVITKANTLTVSGTDYDAAYDGAAHGDAATANVTAGTTVSYSTNGGETWSTTVPQITNVGTVTVQVKAENANYVTATNSYTLTVTPREVTVTGDGWDTDQVYTGTEYSKSTYTFDNVVSGQTASITYRIAGTDVGSYTGKFSEGYADFKVMSGETDVTANYTLKNATPGTLNIVKANTLTVSGTDYNGVYDGAAHGDAATANVTAGTTVSYSTNGGETWSTTATQITDVGEITVQVKAENSNYVTATDSYTLTINPRPVTLTSASDSKQYDGTPLTAESVTVSATTETSGFVAGEGVESYQNFASVMLPNETGNNTFTYTLNSNTKASNYTITPVYGTLTINPRTNPYAITVTAKSGEREYNAQPFTVSGFKEITGTGITGNIQNQYGGSQKLSFTLSNGATFTISGIQSTRTETHVNPAAPAGVDELPYSAYDIPVTGTAVVTDGDGNDVTAQFAVTVNPGTLKITPRSVQLTSGSDTKKYDKSPLTNGTVTVTSGSFANGDGATYNVTGSQTRIGSSNNRFTYTLTGGADPQDYCIEYVYGILTVTPPDDYEIVDKSHEARVYHLGDEITFTITVENIFDTEATVTLTEQEGVEFLDASGNKIGNTYPKTTPGITLAAGEKLTVYAVYTVQEKDLLNGSFTNNVSADISATLDKVTYKGEDEDEDTVKDLEKPKPKLTVVKTTTSTATNPALGYATGETITYEITVTNTGNLTIHDIQVSDLISTAEEPVELTLKGFDGTLAPNESVTFTFEHTVVEEDLGKTITNEAIATGKNDTEDEDYDGEQIPTDVDDEKAKTEDDTEPIRHGLTISKTITNPKEIYKLQTPILYEIVITNTGNVTEQNVTVEDVMINAAHSFRFRFDKLDGGTLVNGKVVFASLAPGETRVITCRYTIGGGDESNVVGNMATVSSDAVTTVSSEVVEAQVETQYTLHIIYVDENWQAVPGVGNYRERLSVGDHYNITSPVVEGYTANRKSVFSGEEGMPAEDVWAFVIYTKDPEEEQPTEPEGSDPTDPSGSEPTDPTYDLTPLPNDQTPLADVDLEGEHTCCIMHLLIMLVSMMLLGFYTSDRKKLQKSIFELQRALKSEGVTIGSSDEEKA